MRSRALRAALTAVGLSLLLTGCGASGKSAADGTVTQPQNSAAATVSAQPTASVSARPTAAPGKDATISDLRARMLAVAGVLRSEDFPGYAVEVEEDDETDAAFDAAMYKCLGAKQPPYLAENPGKSFTKDNVEITSEVDVVRSADEALADLRAFTSAKGEYCWKQTSDAMFETMGVTATGFVVEMSPTTVKGADEAFKVWTALTLSGPGGRISLSSWTIGTVVGATEVSVDLSSQDGAAPKLSRAIELAEVAVQRVRAAEKAPESDADPEVAHLGKASGPQLGA